MCCLYIVATLLSPPRYCFGTGDLGSLRECRKQSRTGSFCLEDRKSTPCFPQFAPDSFKSLGDHIVSQTCALDLGGGQEEARSKQGFTRLVPESCEQSARSQNVSQTDIYCFRVTNEVKSGLYTIGT